MIRFSLRSLAGRKFRTALTMIAIVLGVPMAFFIAKVVPRRWRGLVIALVVTPLWASYLVKAYAWRGMLAGNGVLDWLLDPVGLAGPGLGLTAIIIVLTMNVMPSNGFMPETNIW